MTKFILSCGVGCGKKLRLSLRSVGYREDKILIFELKMIGMYFCDSKTSGDDAI